MSTTTMESVVVVVAEQPQVVQVLDATTAVIDGSNPNQVVEVSGPTVTELVAVVQDSVTLLTVAEQGPAGVGGGSDAAYTHNQSVASALWTAAHNLGKFPSVMVVDNLKAELMADVTYVDANTVQVAFNTARIGSVYFS
jgi:hypothetical protein